MPAVLLRLRYEGPEGTQLYYFDMCSSVLWSNEYRRSLWAYPAASPLSHFYWWKQFLPCCYYHSERGNHKMMKWQKMGSYNSYQEKSKNKTFCYIVSYLIQPWLIYWATQNLWHKFHGWLSRGSAAMNTSVSDPQILRKKFGKVPRSDISAGSFPMLKV